MSRRILFSRAGLLILGTAAAAFVACSVSQKAAKQVSVTKTMRRCSEN